MSFFTQISWDEPNKLLKILNSTIWNLSNLIWNLTRHDEMHLCKFRWNLSERIQNKPKFQEFKNILRTFKDKRNKEEMRSCKGNEKLWKTLKREHFKSRQREKLIYLNRRRSITGRKIKFCKHFSNENKSFKERETSSMNILRKSVCLLGSTTCIK